MKKIGLFILALCLLVACELAPNDIVIDPSLELLNQMTLEEKIGQMLMVRIEALDPTLNSYQANDISQYGITSIQGKSLIYSEIPVGGIILFSKNIETPDQLNILIQDIKSLSDIPIWIGIDEEGGDITRIAGMESFDEPIFKNAGEMKDAAEARNIAFQIGQYLTHYGIDINFAPVSDVNSNKENPVIGLRAFSHDPYVVSEMVSEQIDGYHDAEILCTLKHFPGHGDTSNDTHVSYAAVLKTMDELKETELIPFQNNLHKTDFVMVAHITFPLIQQQERPASLSEEIVYDLLRNKLMYDGIVITDALDMGAITSRYSSEEAAILAIKAGVDILLMPQDLQEAFQGIYEAVLNGEISEERINESVLRILQLKLIN